MEQFYHDDVIKWRHFPRNWPFVRGSHRSPVNSPHKGQWRGALMFSLICVWINAWVNNRDAGDLRRYRVHYDVTVMSPIKAYIHARTHFRGKKVLFQREARIREIKNNGAILYFREIVKRFCIYLSGMRWHRIGQHVWIVMHKIWTPIHILLARNEKYDLHRKMSWVWCTFSVLLILILNTV